MRNFHFSSFRAFSFFSLLFACSCGSRISRHFCYLSLVIHFLRAYMLYVSEIFSHNLPVLRSFTHSLYSLFFCNLLFSLFSMHFTRIAHFSRHLCFYANYKHFCHLRFFARFVYFARFSAILSLYVFTHLHL